MQKNSTIHHIKNMDNIITFSSNDGLVDRFERRFEYLRLSITDQCNFKCSYCLPNGSECRTKKTFLSLLEIERLVNAFVELGVKKIRLTGGEPTLRRDFDDILKLLNQYSEIEAIALTTNGYRLLDNIDKWENLGLTHLNVSLDSLFPHQFKQITGDGRFAQIMSGIEKALSYPRIKVKINTVLMRNVNDVLDDYLPWIRSRAIEHRFIELMETNVLSDTFNQHHISGRVIERQLEEQGWVLQTKQALSGPAKIYAHNDYLGKIGLIMPYSNEFCVSCNRLRISSQGKLHYCLFGDSAIDLRSFLKNDHQKSALKDKIIESLKIKPETHFLHQHQSGMTDNLSVIGG